MHLAKEVLFNDEDDVEARRASAIAAMTDLINDVKDKDSKGITEFLKQGSSLVVSIGPRRG